MNLKKNLRKYIKQAFIPDVSKQIFNQIPISNVLIKNESFKKRTFTLQFSAFLILLLGVSVFSYQQTTNQIYAFSDYEEVMGVSVGMMFTYYETLEDDTMPNAPLSYSTQMLDDEIQRMLRYMRIVEKLAFTQSRLIVNKQIQEEKEMYQMQMITMDQKDIFIDIEVEKTYKNFKQDIFDFQARFNDIQFIGTTTLKNHHHHFYLTASHMSIQFELRYNTSDKRFEVTILRDGLPNITFNYEIERDNLNLPTISLAYTNDDTFVELQIHYNPIRKKMVVSYKIEKQSQVSEGTYNVSFKRMQGIIIDVEGQTDDGQSFQYQFQRNIQYRQESQ